MCGPRQKLHIMLAYMGLPRWQWGKESICRCRRHRFDSWVRRIPWRRAWQPTLVFLPGKFHGQRSLAGYSSWGCKVGYNWVTELSTLAYLFIHSTDVDTIYTMQCPLECRVQINPLHLFVEMRTDLETVIQSAVNKKENKCHNIAYMWNLEK